MKAKAWMATVLAVGLWVGSAMAEESALNAEFDVRFQEGENLYRERQYERARVVFLQALALSPQDSKVLLNLAICEQALGHNVDALGRLKQYLAHPKVSRTKVQELKDTMHRKLWNATGHLKVVADRGDGIVLNGNTQLGNAPLADIVDVEPGSYRVTAGDRTMNVTVAAGETKDVNLASPAQPLIPPPAEERPSRSVEGWIVPGALGVLGVAGLGIGIGYAASSRSAKDSERALRTKEPCLDANSAACMELRDARDSVSNRKTVSNIGYVVGGVAVAGAVAAWFLWPQSKRETGVAIHPVVGAGTAGLHFSGNF